ncbi:hypothetical protein PPYR_01667 [Photinus pyralis]|uniref:Nonsense-mediated mRNA decay factor SMG8 n=1 Tax=Photinus pyralis TaxID=7054 RepID=A0A5N4B511_PHOPY|nr:protein smg8 [Photinus pyralis]KAB0804697.1 hypothetical protein PPYR_01667 [Photinus pyralis]
MNIKTFIVPEIVAYLKNVATLTEKVVVVSIIGKSAYNANLKVKSLCRMFSEDNISSRDHTIEGYYDPVDHIIYLHVHSLLDTDALIKHYDDIVKRCQEEGKNDDFLTVYNEIKSTFAQMLLVLFYVSHIVVLSHPSSSFDVNYIQYFKAIDQLRQKLSGQISDCLREIDGISLDWINNCRPCTPRLLFYFERCPKGVTNIKKLEHDIEDRIYHILRKIRIISSTNTSSLFAIPPNEEFVYMSEEEQVDRLGHAVRSLILGCQPGAMLQVEVPYCSQPDIGRSFKSFLQVHIQHARSKGFDDNVTSSRHSQQLPAYFELPSLQHWAEACEEVYKVVMKQETMASLSTDTRFSEQRCLKVLPLALARYQESVAIHYTRAAHEARLALALAFFAAQARGPLFHQYSAQLVADCTAYWETGRQSCEVASLTGNPCTLPKHSSDQEHCNTVRYIAVCDCGRKQGTRDDPYTPKQANFTFYNQLGKECTCHAAQRHFFPVFQPSIKEYTAATLTENDDTVLSDERGDLTPDLDRSLVRQASTTEYLPGMLTLSSPPGLLPCYSSWSLVYLGPSSLYSHNLGLSESHHPGFVNSTNYLLPWDVTVYSKGRTSWPQLSKHSSRGRRPRASNSMPQFTVKVFIGVEYECPRGHRFMLAAPDKVLRAAPGSIVKDTGHKIAESDMPLYFPCPCRQSKPLTAQLMRLHVVTPKSLVHCTLNPKVQPAQGAPIFVPSVEGPTVLSQSAYWVMRLPYAYVSDKESYPENISARLLSGVFGVSEVE